MNKQIIFYPGYHFGFSLMPAAIPRHLQFPNEDNIFPNNKICTTKYNAITFLPLFLIDQFSKPSNLYFLIISILQVGPVYYFY